MTIETLLREHRETLIKQWTEAIFSTYPLDTTGFLRNSRDPFTNPVGSKTLRAVEVMYDAISGCDMPDGEPESALADLVRIRAIQNFTPEKALGVIFSVKPLLRKAVLPAALEHGLLNDFLEVESRVDTLSLLAFRHYAQDREQLHMLKVDEYKRRYAQLIRRAEMIVDEPAGEPDQSTTESLAAR